MLAGLDGSAYAGWRWTVVQGMELPDVGIEIPRGGRQIRVAQPQRHRVHRIPRFELAGSGFMPEVVKPEARNAGATAARVPRGLNIADPGAVLVAEDVVECGVRLAGRAYLT